MEYTQTLSNGQIKFNLEPSYLLIPSSLTGFNNTNTDIKTAMLLWRNASDALEILNHNK